MTLSPTGVAYAVLFLAIGMAELYVFLRVVYPVISLRHELQKVTYSQGRSPALVTNLVRLQSLVLMPIIGYLLGAHILTSGAN